MPNESRPQPAPKRLLELDALRGLAALAVVLFHFTSRYDEMFGHAQPLWWALPWGHCRGGTTASICSSCSAGSSS